MRKRKLFGCAAAAAAGIAAHVSLDRANRDANGAPPMGHVAPAQLAPSQVNHYLSGADSRLGFPSWAATLTGSLLSGIRRRLEQPRVIYCEGGLEGNALSGEGGKGSGKGAEVDASGRPRCRSWSSGRLRCTPWRECRIIQGCIGLACRRRSIRR